MNEVLDIAPHNFNRKDGLRSKLTAPAKHAQ